MHFPSCLRKEHCVSESPSLHPSQDAAGLPLLQRSARFFKFALVGGSGVVVNQLMLWLGVSVLFVSWPDKQAIALASFVAIGVSILTNFVLNDAWTWGDRDKASPWLFRFIKYALVASVAGGVQWIVLLALVDADLHTWMAAQLGLDGLRDAGALLANFVGIAAGIVINYFANNWWTFRAIEEEADPQAADTSADFHAASISTPATRPVEHHVGG